ncbi:peptidylprolyl isomerase [Burkholderia oklahomensis]|uniref:peptidylprolyl isomerase n=1 Tax=Burkholderia oklahomensis TaxID=342113 RepID=UPI00047333C3|nr:peptidylprolyl isomerase [Burkholderia oklahomensis]AJX32886.1 cyclophilin type peptidyl-prolyl cis-trans isomerase/CLD family protein [Burkholderia oklahomensis C6786]AOI47679.1 peptidylprolyl isomerase [Burkholderia oklahomensis C6786]KUY50782.1 peptidylprolyl isomerase [Burkholderia oklahomensis C6786]MBI0358357.1 peptidylprolyl isomerase [Burkholderia oklahomensis]SUW56395.1 Peptidyl-prolyl cis-trans isomerase A precursor [Burkholderia oklahomensis]
MNRRSFIGGSLGLCAGAALPVALDWSEYAGDYLEMALSSGIVTIKLNPDVAPNHVNRIKSLVRAKFYDAMPFARVVDGFMAQTGDPRKGTDVDLASLPKLNAEFSHLPFERGTVGMARSRNPNSACHQFFVTLADAAFLDGRYTAFGKVTSGMELIDQLRLGVPDTGKVANPDLIGSVRLTAG